jgi:hypothetical protein
MTVKTDFVLLASGLFSGRVYPQTAPSAVVAPYCTYSRIIAIEQATLDANGGTGNTSNTRLQIDVWALSYGEAQALAAAVKTALKAWAVENVLLAEEDFYEGDTGLHRVMLDLSTWHD